MIKEYRSNTFSLLMQEPKYALQVFNALNGTHYDDESEIQINMLENGIQLTVRNDASFLLDGYLSLYEHQSTKNPNMPLRGLLYIARLLEEYTKERNLYGSSLIGIPSPQFVVLYNGEEKQPEEQVPKLSDAYLNKDIPSGLELTCKVLNINGHNNPYLTENCDAIRGNMTFVDRIRQNYIGRDREVLKTYIQEALEFCISHDILAEFFWKYRDDIQEVEMIDLTYETRMKYEIRDAREEARAEAQEEAKAERERMIQNLMAAMNLSYDEACKILSV